MHGLIGKRFFFDQKGQGSPYESLILQQPERRRIIGKTGLEQGRNTYNQSHASNIQRSVSSNE